MYKNSIINLEKQIYKLVEQQNTLYNLNEYNCYKNNNDLANYIHKNYDNLNMEEMKTLCFKCTNENYLKKTLLEYEFKNRKLTTPNSKLSIDNFIKEALRIFNKYQTKICGNYIEDITWNIKKNNDVVYFLNTISKPNSYNNDIIFYLERLIDYLDELCINIKSKLTLDESKEDKIVYIKIKSKNIK